MAWSTARALSSALLLAACQRVPLDEDPGPIEEDTDTDTSDVPTSEPPDDSNGDDGPVFGCEPGVDSTCPSGQKCTALSDGGVLQNNFQCVNDDGTLPAGESCTPAPGTGQDSCTAGTVCLTDAPEASLGACLELCGNGDECEPGKCTESPYTLTPFCAPACDPLFPDCQMGRACLQADDRFVCGMPVADFDIGVTNEQCDPISLRGCAEGFACMTGSLVPACTFPACCTNVCDQNGDGAECTSPALCRPLFPEPSPGFEALGACYVPT